MKKGILGTWFREFATIVFTQTVQAFLLAIVLSVIVSSLADAGSDSVSAAGLLAIIALSSFGKIELLVKNIFGVTSSFGDPGSLRAGKGFTAGTAMALRGANRLKDNFSKFGEGKRMINEGKMGMLAMGDGNSSENGTNQNNKENNTYNSENTDNIDDISEEIEKSQEHIMRLEGANDISALTQAIRNLTNATNTANKSEAQTKREKYQEMINEGQNLKRSAVRENIGAAIGGVSGAIVGLADGENVMQNALTGAGVGDAIGASSAKRSADRESYNKEMKKLGDKINELRNSESKESQESYKKGIEALEKQLTANGMNGVKNNIEFRIKNTPVVGNSSRETRKALKEIQKDIDRNSNAGNTNK